MKLAPYLLFNGDCAEAFRFYERALGGRKLELMPHRGTPASAHVPDGWQDKIMHAYLEVGDSALMASDVPPEHQKPVGGFSVSYHAADEAEAEHVFAALAEGGTVTMAMEATFWAKRFGMLVDRFGIPWMVNCAAAEA
jgi:PhnB protein